MDKKPVTHFLVGGIMGAITILSSVILIITDQIQNQKLGWISSVSMLIPLIYFIRDYGNAKQNQLSFDDLFAFGFKSSAFATILILAFQVIFNFAFPEMLDKILDSYRQQMIEQKTKLTDEQIEMALGFTKKFFWPVIIGGTLFKTLLFGAIGSLIGAAITKKNPPTQFQHV